MSGTVIELDRDAPPPEEPVLLSSHWRRAVGLAVTAVVSAGVLVAAAPFAESRIVEVARVDASVVTMRIAGSTLVTVTSGQLLNGYRLADGALRWSVPLPPDVDGQTGIAGIDVVDGVAVVNNQSTTVGVDIATGRQLWHSDLPRLAEVHTTHTVLLGTYLTDDGQPDPSAQDAGPPRLPLMLRAIEARTGRTIWEYRVPAGWWSALPYAWYGLEPASHFVVGSPDGRVTTLDLATGEAVTSAVIGESATPSSGPASYRGQALFGDQLLVATGGNLAAYQPSTLARQWTIALTDDDFLIPRCGPWLCFDDGLTLRALSRETGKPAWTMKSGQGVRAWVGQGVYRGPEPGDPGDATLVDPVTQRIALDLGDWRVIDAPDAGPVLLRRSDVGPGVTWIGLLTDGPRVDPLGAVTALGEQPCDLDGNGYLACLTINGDLRIWRYRP